jgi:hypothetical protein
LGKIYFLGSGITVSIPGMSRVSFLLELHNYGVLMIDLTEEELLSDLKNTLKKADRYQ